jgi:branched-chain amino acid transport system substrate-binding protein
LINLPVQSITRFADNCARQGYHPYLGIVGVLASSELANNPNLDRALGPLQTVPYFLSGTPATDEYQTAIRTYGVPNGAGPIIGWTAGKLLEKAAANLPEPPTTEAILAGLWSIKGDTLGGLTLPLTFTKDQPPAITPCWFPITIKDKAWSSPDGGKPHCQ